MTTIAATRKQMSGDSRVSSPGQQYHCDKVYSIGDSLVGVCGDANNTTKFLAWFRRECPADEIGMSLEDTDFAALVVNPRGIFVYADCVEPDRIHEAYYAIGSGGQAAIIAMMLGKNTADAVRLASRVDPCTGGKIKTLSLAHRKRKVVAARVDAVLVDHKPEGSNGN